MMHGIQGILSAGEERATHGGAITRRILQQEIQRL